MKYRKASRQEVIQINDILRNVCCKRDDGTCIYNENWNDQKVADEIGGGLSVHSVKFIRRELFGEICAPKPADREGELEKRVSELEACVASQGRTISNTLDTLSSMADRQARSFDRFPPLAQKIDKLEETINFLISRVQKLEGKPGGFVPPRMIPIMEPGALVRNGAVNPADELI